MLVSLSAGWLWLRSTETFREEGFKLPSHIWHVLEQSPTLQVIDMRGTQWEQGLPFAQPDGQPRTSLVGSQKQRLLTLLRKLIRLTPNGERVVVALIAPCPFQLRASHGGTTVWITLHTEQKQLLEYTVQGGQENGQVRINPGWERTLSDLLADS